MKQLGYGVGAVLIALVSILAWAWQSVTWYDPVVDVATSCDAPSAQWSSDQPLKVLSYNVQYMASKNYFFFYDAEAGTDSKPSLEHTAWTLDQVAKIVSDENPDILMLQEINDDADARTHGVDQVAELQKRLATLAYPCRSDAHYWQAGLVLHPKVLGSVSMKLTTLSRYPLHSARRHQLPLMDNDPVTQRFYFQRALLETHITSTDGQNVALINTHFDAWGAGSDLMQRQVATTQALLDQLDASNTPWIFGGDLNSLPPDGKRQWQRLEHDGVGEYDEDTALLPLYERYGAIPALAQLMSSDEAEVAKWHTHFSNDPRVTKPDRTIDYLFYSRDWTAEDARIRQHDTLDVSDHLPVVATFSLAEG